MGARSFSSSTPALRAAVSASSGIGSHAPNTISSSPDRGTKSLISGERCSVRLPRRIVAIWVREPIGFECPLRTLSTPAMKVVATAPSPGVSTPRRPAAGRIAGLSPAGRPLPEVVPCTTYSPFAMNRCSGRAPRGTRSRRIVQRAYRPRWLRLQPAMHGLDALRRGDPRGNGQQDDDCDQNEPMERQTEKRLRRREQHHALGTLQDADARIDPEPFRARARVRSQERPDQREHARADHWHAPPFRTRREEHRESAEHESIRDAVERRIIKRAEHRASLRSARHFPIQHVEQRRQPEQPAAEPDVPESIQHAAGDRAQRANRRDRVRMHVEANQPHRHRIDEAQISCFEPVRQYFHPFPRAILDSAVSACATGRSGMLRPVKLSRSIMRSNPRACASGDGPVRART